MFFLRKLVLPLFKKKIFVVSIKFAVSPAAGSLINQFYPLIFSADLAFTAVIINI